MFSKHNSPWIIIIVFQNNIFPVINRPNKSTKTGVTIFDHILTNNIIESPLHSGVVKTDFSDHFAMFHLLETIFEQSDFKNIIIDWEIKEEIIEQFKSLFNSIDWNLVA